jgi:hypothetical protein
MSDLGLKGKDATDMTEVGDCSLLLFAKPSPNIRTRYSMDPPAHDLSAFIKTPCSH